MEEGERCERGGERESLLDGHTHPVLNARSAHYTGGDSAPSSVNRNRMVFGYSSQGIYQELGSHSMKVDLANSD